VSLTSWALDVEVGGGRGDLVLKLSPRPAGPHARTQPARRRARRHECRRLAGLRRRIRCAVRSPTLQLVGRVLQTAFELVVEVILRMARESSGAPSSTGPDEARPEDRSAGRRARDRHACFEWSETPGARRRARGWLIAVERWTAYQAVLLTLFRGTFLAGTALTAVCVSVFRSAAVVFTSAAFLMGVALATLAGSADARSAAMRSTTGGVGERWSSPCC
jgi:hypothetical protein